MKLIHTTNYKIYNQKLKKDLKVAIISDLHFSKYIKNSKLDIILNDLKRENPDYILFPGDFINSEESIIQESEYERILSWAKKLATICTVIFSLGNHDCYKKMRDKETNRRKLVFGFNEPFFKDLGSIKNIIVLNNDSFEDQNIFVSGISLSLNYYHDRHKDGTSTTENKNLLIQELDEFRKKIMNIPSDKISILSIHAPLHMTDSEITKYVCDYDYYVSGHMHNGCVPPILYEIWNSSKGIIGPNKRFWVKNARNTMKYDTDKLIVTGPLTTFHADTGILKVANAIFPSYVSIVEFTTDKKYNTKKISIKSKYHK